MGQSKLSYGDSNYGLGEVLYSPIENIELFRFEGPFVAGVSNSE